MTNESKEELTERYGDCCEVSYELIEQDKQKAIEEYQEKVREAIEKFIERLDKGIIHYQNMPNCPSCDYNFNDHNNSGAKHQIFILRELLKELNLEVKNGNKRKN